jgi:3-oxoacyl-[acyl-carrier-protein] synthase-3
MGTIIEATATASAHRRRPAPGALKLADAAARLCLQRAGRAPAELDLLINAGVYHDRLMNEPALAALIQEDIEANPDLDPGAEHGTFSFDVSNGACGLLTGIHLVDGLLASGTIHLGMVLASDADPEPGISEGFGFDAIGGAFLLSADDARAGFEAFRFATFPEFADLFQSYVDWHEDARHGLVRHGRNILSVEIAESYAVRALECAEATVRELADAQALELGEIDLLVATASVPGFADRLATRLGLSTARIASAPDSGLDRAHTAAPAVALESGALGAAKTALFVSAGAGITVAAALYRA